MSELSKIERLVDGLAEPDTRRAAAAVLGAALGCEELLLLVLDTDIQAFVPALGMAKTLRGGLNWRRFLKECAIPGRHHALVDLPASDRRHARAYSTGTALVVAVGGNVDALAMSVLESRMQLLGALMLSQQARRQQEADVELAREGAARAHTLALALDAARSAAAELNAKLQDESERKDEFLAMLAHELRNPLAPLVNSVELLRRVANGEHPTFRRALGVMDRQLSQLSRLVNDLLDVSRVSRGKIQLDREILPLAEVLQAARETAAPLIQAKSHRLAINDVSESVVVDGDRTRLIQVFANLLNNAAKYTEREGQITIHSTVDDGRVSVSISDNGVGIPSDKLEAVFDLFHQVHSTLDRSDGGLGIGLTLARSLATLHGGQITAHSAGSGHGSTFTVTLPIAREVVRRARTIHIPVSRERLDRVTRVLVVEDNVDGAATMEALLRELKTDVRVAGSAEDALATVQRFRPELVLADIGLPGMSGYELASQLRSLLGRGVRLVALTGYGSQRDQAKAAQAGFDEHLVKPASIDALERLIHLDRAAGAA